MLTKEQIEKLCEGIRNEMFVNTIRDEYGKIRPDPFTHRMEYWGEVRTTLTVLYAAGMVDGAQYKIIVDALSDALTDEMKRNDPRDRLKKEEP